MIQLSPPPERTPIRTAPPAAGLRSVQNPASTLFGGVVFGKLWLLGVASAAKPPPTTRMPLLDTPSLVHISPPKPKAGTLKLVIVSSPTPAIGATPNALSGR